MPLPDRAVTVRPISELTDLVFKTMDGRNVRADVVKDDAATMVVTLTVYGGKRNTPRGE